VVDVENVKAGSYGVVPWDSSVIIPARPPHFGHLVKSTPLPGQPGSFMGVGRPDSSTRQRVSSGIDPAGNEKREDGKDKWLSEPPLVEKRDARKNTRLGLATRSVA
jgi:hypothetical protein